MRIAFIIGLTIIFDVIYSLFINAWSYQLFLFLPLFSLVAIIYIYRYLENNLTVYFLISFLLGLFYDVSITNTGVFNGLIYVGLAVITALVASYFKPHYLVNMSLVAINITIYLIISYLFLTFYDLYLFNWWQTLFAILGGYLINVTYLTILTVIDRPKRKVNKYLKL